MEIILNATEEKTLQKLTDGRQTTYAETLLDNLAKFVGDGYMIRELTPRLLMDALGYAGLSLVAYDSASREFMEARTTNNIAGCKNN
jgi:hypothetical protein